MIFMDSVPFPGQEGTPGGQFVDVAKLSPSFNSHASALRVTQAFQTTPAPMQQLSACCFCFFLWHQGGSRDRNRGWELAIGFKSAKRTANEAEICTKQEAERRWRNKIAHFASVLKLPVRIPYLSSGSACTRRHYGNACTPLGEDNVLLCFVQATEAAEN